MCYSFIQYNDVHGIACYVMQNFHTRSPGGGGGEWGV